VATPGLGWLPNERSGHVFEETVRLSPAGPVPVLLLGLYMTG
jgi:hypothetical protein